MDKFLIRTGDRYLQQDGTTWADSIIDARPFDSRSDAESFMDANFSGWRMHHVRGEAIEFVPVPR